MQLVDATPQIRGNSTSLVILLHAPTSCPEKMDHVTQAVAEKMPDADLMIPRLPLHIMSNADPVNISIAVMQSIDMASGRAASPGGYNE